VEEALLVVIPTLRSTRSTQIHPDPKHLLQVRFVDAWKKLFSSSYDNRIRGYDVVTGTLEHEWENERRCHFVWIEVWAGGCVGVVSPPPLPHTGRTDSLKPPCPPTSSHLFPHLFPHLSRQVDPEFEEVLAVDALGWLSVFSVKTGRLFATKQICSEPIISITK
jgi:hypothetical protein